MKLREVAGSVVATIPQEILSGAGLQTGDRVLVEAAPPKRILITKEGPIMQSSQRLQLEIDLLEKRLAAIQSDLQYKERQYNSNMACDEGMSDPDVAILVMTGIGRDRDQLAVEIAQKRLQLFDLGAGASAGPTENEVGGPTRADRPPRLGDPKITPTGTHAERILRAAAALVGRGSTTFSRNAVRKALGLGAPQWQSGFNSIFQAMRDDQPGGAPSIANDFVGTLHRADRGSYELTRRGRALAIRIQQ